MADLVRTIVEDMLPDLTALGRRKIFSKKEIREIIKAREKAEYIFLRKNVTKKDYLKALNYELELESQRRTKMKELNSKRQTQKDFSIIRRIIYIFDRLTNKYRYDIDIWKEYLYFCYKIKSSRNYFKAISRCLELNPGCLSNIFSILTYVALNSRKAIWTLGVYYQFEVNANPFRARKLFLRAIQLNGNVKEFWIEYFRFELRFVDKIKAREKIIAGTGSQLKKKDDVELVVEKGEEDDLVVETGNEHNGDMEIEHEDKKEKEEPNSFIEFDEAEDSTYGKKMTAMIEAYSKDTDSLLILVFETAMEKFKADFDLGIEFLRTFNDFVADWTNTAREKIYGELKKLSQENIAKTLKLEWIYSLLDNPSKIGGPKTFEKNLSKCEKILFAGLEKNEDQHQSRELLKQWLSLWICQKEFSVFYNQADREGYKKAAEAHFERLSALSEFNDLVSLDRKIIDDFELIVNRLEFSSKTLKKVLKKIQAFKLGLPNEGFLLDEDFNQAKNSSANDLADLKKVLKAEHDKLSPQAILHMLKAVALRDSTIWSSGSSEQILSLIKLAVKSFLLTPNNLEEFFNLIISQMNKADVGEEFQLDLYEEMIQLLNLCPASAYVAYAEYLIKNKKDQKDVKEIRKILNKGLSFHKASKTLWLLLFKVEKDFGDPTLCSTLFQKAKKEIKDEAFTAEYFAFMNQ